MLIQPYLQTIQCLIHRNVGAFMSIHWCFYVLKCASLKVFLHLSIYLFTCSSIYMSLGLPVHLFHLIWSIVWFGSIRFGSVSFGYRQRFIFILIFIDRLDNNEMKIKMTIPFNFFIFIAVAHEAKYTSKHFYPKNQSNFITVFMKNIF